MRQLLYQYMYKLKVIYVHVIDDMGHVLKGKTNSRPENITL